ncbi:hypothetical protein RRG08_031802 [Elysia crispata]|uniref:Uncharacterized protein n=1 Tax=Elysia crispata TaxID=231223 RepID=A0AAE0Y6I1_9GAST|nr:hypothetical protein RRG08_031802 [Elysia crispata]
MEDTNHLWNQVKTTYQEAGRTFLGHRNERHKDWISQEAWQKIKEKKDIKKKVLSTKSERIKTQQQQAYREADRAVKQIIRHDKRKHLEDMATQAEEAAYKGDQRTLYKITKQVLVPNIFTDLHPAKQVQVLKLNKTSLLPTDAPFIVCFFMSPRKPENEHYKKVVASNGWGCGPRDGPRLIRTFSFSTAKVHNSYTEVRPSYEL